MYLGIDLGTSSVKIIMMDDNFNVVAHSSQNLTISRLKPLWSEQNPQEWWDATCVAMNDLKKSHAKELMRVKAIGLSGQMHGAVLLDKQAKVLRPAILWNDGRSAEQCQQLESGMPDIIDITCNRVMPGFTAPKVFWVKQHEPDIFKQVAKILLPKDYLRLKISGDYASDMSDASGTSWLDVKNRCWSDKILNFCDLTEQQMPTLYEGNQITGNVLPEVAKEWGISEDVVIAAGGGDNAATAISMNVIRSGSAFLSLGTSGVYFISSDICQPHVEQGVHTFAHCLPNLWHSMNCHLSAANCLTWLAELTNSDVKTLVKNAEQHQMREPLFFLPYLSGERSPHNNASARGMFFGLSHSTTQEDMMQAVLEGVAYNFREGQDALEDINIKDIYVVGGGARSAYWGEILSAVLNKELNYCEDAEVGGALGAARLGYLAANNADPFSAFPANSVKMIIKPDAKKVAYYEKYYPFYKALYANNKKLFNEIY